MKQFIEDIRYAWRHFMADRREPSRTKSYMRAT